MIKGIIVGFTALGVGIALERYLGADISDLRRYNRLRAMSDEPPLLKSIFAPLGGIAGELGGGLQGDIARYIKIKSM